MDERRRRSYLKAMGVMVWEPRASAGGESALNSESTVVQPTEPAATATQVSPATEPMRSAIAEPDVTPSRATRSEAGMDRAPLRSDASERGRIGVSDTVAVAQSAVDPSDPGEVVSQMDWGALAAAVSDCRACRLWETRTQTVFGVGNRTADLMIVGEAPGADEDRVGEPFVGRAGQLLDRMLAAIGCPREQVYIANVLKCRPPGNRDPRQDEMLRCQDYLIRQMELIRPQLILAVGRISAQHLLGTDTPLGRLRGRWLAFGQNAIPLRVTYHPAYLLRSPDQKAKAWADLTEVRRRLDAVRASPGEIDRING